MIASQQMLTLFEDIQAFLTPQIQNGKCILVVGACSSGKTCLIKYFSGVAFTRDTNEEDLPFLVQNPDVIPQVQVKLFTKQKISLELTLLKTYDVNSEEVTIIEMPSFASLTSQTEQQEQTPGMLTFNKIIYGIFTWNTVLNLAKQVHIFLLAPYQFITDDHKLVEFFSIWQKFLIQNQQFRAQIKQCLTIIFTKPEYEDDKQSLITSLDHLSQSGSQQIGLNNSFSSAAQSSRVFCFLSQDTQQGQGPELLNNIMQQADFYLSSQNGLLAPDWAQSFMWSIMKQSGDEKLKSVLKLVEIMFKKIIESQQKANKTFQKSLSILANASTLNLIKSLPKQSQLKKKQKQLQQQIKQKIKQQPIITNELISKIEGNAQKTDKILNGFIKITTIIQSAIKQELMFQQLVDNVETQFWEIFGVDDESKNVISHWINQRLFIWKYPSIFSKLCSQHKDNMELQHQTQAIDDLNKEMTTKVGKIMKQKIGNGLRYYQIIQRVGQIKTIAESEQYKQMTSIYKIDTNQPSQQQQQKQIQQNPLIKRWYFKTQQNINININIDFITIIKEKSKKVVIKQINKKQDINEREQIKILLSLLEREPENRKQNLIKLAKKLRYFQFYQFALEAYMDLADPIQLYQFVTQSYCQKVKDSNVEFIRVSLIPYLEEKAAIASLYMAKEQAQYFVYTAQFCYDFLAVNFAETAEEYVEIATLSNEIQIADEKQFEEEELKDLDLNLSTFGVSNNKDMQFLKYISFSKAEIIEKINERDQKNKKNNLAYNQIKKFLQAPKIELKAK